MPSWRSLAISHSQSKGLGRVGVVAQLVSNFLFIHQVMIDHAQDDDAVEHYLGDLQQGT